MSLGSGITATSSKNLGDVRLINENYYYYYLSYRVIVQI
jgi:hypothetical protein